MLSEDHQLMLEDAVRASGSRILSEALKEISDIGKNILQHAAEIVEQGPAQTLSDVKTGCAHICGSIRDTIDQLQHAEKALVSGMELWEQRIRPAIDIDGSDDEVEVLREIIYLDTNNCEQTDNVQPLPITVCSNTEEALMRSEVNQPNASVCENPDTGKDDSVNFPPVQNILNLSMCVRPEENLMDIIIDFPC